MTEDESDICQNKDIPNQRLDLFYVISSAANTRSNLSDITRSRCSLTETTSDEYIHEAI